MARWLTWLISFPPVAHLPILSGIPVQSRRRPVCPMIVVTKAVVVMLIACSLQLGPLDRSHLEDSVSSSFHPVNSVLTGVGLFVVVQALK